jgi:hypothetical protein
MGFQQQLKQHSGMLFMNPMVTYFFDLRIMSTDMTDWILTQLHPACNHSLNQIYYSCPLYTYVPIILTICLWKKWHLSLLTWKHLAWSSYQETLCKIDPGKSEMNNYCNVLYKPYGLYTRLAYFILKLIAAIIWIDYLPGGPRAYMPCITDLHSN